MNGNEISKELESLFNADQNERLGNVKISKKEMEKNDFKRYNRVIEIIKTHGLPQKKPFSRLVDYHHTALILHHNPKIKGALTLALYLMSYALKQGFEDKTGNARLLYAQIKDRAALLTEGKQYFGTQFNENGKLLPVGSKCRDEDRAKYGIMPLNIIEIHNTFEIFKTNLLKFAQLLFVNCSEKIKNNVINIDSTVKNVEKIQELKKELKNLSDILGDIKRNKVIEKMQVESNMMNMFLDKSSSFLTEQIKNKDNSEMTKALIFQEKQFYEEMSQAL